MSEPQVNDGDSGGGASRPGSAPSRGPSSRGLLCVACEHLNPAGSERCEECDSKLFVACARCGARNQRVHSRCGQCNRRLHRSVTDWVKSTSEPGSVNFAVLGLVLLGVVAAIIALLRYARVRIPFLDP